MSKAKEPISVEKIQIAIAMLDAMKQSLEKAVQDASAYERDHVMIEGWPTFARGYNFMLDQATKVVGAISFVDNLDPHDMLMPGQEYAPTKKPYQARVKADVRNAARKSNTKAKRDGDKK